MNMDKVDYKKRQVEAATLRYKIKPGEETELFHKYLLEEEFNGDRKASRNGWPAERAARRVRYEDEFRKRLESLPDDFRQDDPSRGWDALAFYSGTKLSDHEKGLPEKEPTTPLEKIKSYFDDKE